MLFLCLLLLIILITSDLGRGICANFPSIKLEEYVTNTFILQNIDHAPSAALLSSSRSSGKPFNIACYVDYNNFSIKCRSFLTIVTKGKEPRSFREAIQHPVWCKGMKDEIDALERNGTWTL